MRTLNHFCNKMGKLWTRILFRFLHLLICCVYGEDVAFACLILDLEFLNNSIWPIVKDWSDELIILVASCCIFTCCTDVISLLESSHDCVLNFCCVGLWFHFIIFLYLQLPFQLQFSKNGHFYFSCNFHVFFFFSFSSLLL